MRASLLTAMNVVDGPTITSFYVVVNPELEQDDGKPELHEPAGGNPIMGYAEPSGYAEALGSASPPAVFENTVPDRSKISSSSRTAVFKAVDEALIKS